MARTKKAAETPVDVNEAANRADLNTRALRSRTTLHNELVVSEGMRIAAEQECGRLRTEVMTLKSAAMPPTTIVGVGALAACLGYPPSYLASVISGLRKQGLPCTIEDGTYVFNLPDVHTWFVDRREVTTTEALKIDFKNLSISQLGEALGKTIGEIREMAAAGMPHVEFPKKDTADLAEVIEWMIRQRVMKTEAHFIVPTDQFDAVIDALNLVVAQTDAVMDASGDNWLEDEDTAEEVARLSNIQRHLREAVDHLAEMVS